MKANLLILLLISTAGCVALSSIKPTAKAQFTAMYIFGDSLTDPGNNNYFINTIAKANYWPNGLDFDGGPTGRFSNGKILVDFLDELLGFPLLPSYADTIAKGADILSGVNYASAGAGILNDTGYVLGRVIPLSEQITTSGIPWLNPETKCKKKELSKYLARALVFMDMGANDYLNNYLFPKNYISSHIYNPPQFADLLIKDYTYYILELRSLGLRKFFLAEASPIGCAPMKVTNGEYDSSSNNLVQMFNLQLKSLVYRLNSDYPGSIFTLGASFRIFINLRDNADAYGVKVKDAACCRSRGSKHLCPRNSVPCSNRDEYLFWDAAQPTQAADRILAQCLYNSSSYSFPVSIQQMAIM